jgi:hypothetical protein
MSMTAGFGQTIRITMNPKQRAAIRTALLDTFTNVANRSIAIASNPEEVIVASLIEGPPDSPGSLSCSIKTCAFTIANQNSTSTTDMVLIQPTGSPNSLFNNANNTYPFTGSVSFADPDYNVGISTLRYQAQTPTIPYLIMRIPVLTSGAGNLRSPKSMLEVVCGDDPNIPRILGGQMNLKPGSVIKISNSVLGNDGIYNVLSVTDGIPGDTWWSTYGINGASRVQYLELDRPFVATGIDTNPITIEDITSISPPILNVSYNYPIP